MVLVLWRCLPLLLAGIPESGLSHCMMGALKFYLVLSFAVLGGCYLLLQAPTGNLSFCVYFVYFSWRMFFFFYKVS